MPVSRKTRWTTSVPGTTREAEAVVTCRRMPADDQAQPRRVHEGETAEIEHEVAAALLVELRELRLDVVHGVDVEVARRAHPRQAVVAADVAGEDVRRRSAALAHEGAILSGSHGSATVRTAIGRLARSTAWRRTSLHRAWARRDRCPTTSRVRADAAAPGRRAARSGLSRPGGGCAAHSPPTDVAVSGRRPGGGPSRPGGCATPASATRRSGRRSPAAAGRARTATAARHGRARSASPPRAGRA